MLNELIIKNFILIKELSLEFNPGFSAITGETGAGKSILIQALKLIMGDRASTDVIGPYGNTSIVEAIFDINKSIQEKLIDLDIPFEDQELIIRRVISSKRSRIYVNGLVVTLTDLRELTKHLISIEGQHAFQQLMYSKGHLELLDRFAELYPIRRQLLTIYKDVKELDKKIEELFIKKKKSNEYQEIIKKEISEIEKVNPKINEDIELEQEINILKSAVELKQVSSNAYDKLYSKRGSAYEIVSETKAELSNICELDPRLDKIFSELENLTYQLEDISFSLRDYEKSLVIDPIRLEQKQARLSDIKRLLRRYGPNIKDVLEHLNILKTQLKSISEIEQEIEKLQKKQKQQSQKLLEISANLSRERKKYAKELEKLVSKELKDLNMGMCNFNISIKTPSVPSINEINQTGWDKIEFLFSSNPGIPPKPISQIASGGELSRLMLAIKAVLSNKATVETLVFDEIDAGIGGESAKKVGIKLKKLAENAQVIAVTHFPQIAALSTTQYIVKKSQSQQKTTTTIRQLDPEQRVIELARMLGTDTKEAKIYAKRLLKEAKDIKSE